jgi:hypothetical protein
MGKSVLKVDSGKWKGYALVRDANGVPKVDDPATLPEQIKEMLTDEEYFSIYKHSRK